MGANSQGTHIKSCRKQCKHGEGVWQDRTRGKPFKFAILCAIHHAIAPEDGKDGMATFLQGVFFERESPILDAPHWWCCCWCCCCRRHYFRASYLYYFLCYHDGMLKK